MQTNPYLEVTEESNPYLGLPEEKKPSLLKGMGKSLETGKEIGLVYPVIETGANLISQLWGLPISGLAGMAGLPFGKEKEFQQAAAEATIYQPKTEKGKKLTETIMLPFEVLGHLSEMGQDYVWKLAQTPEGKKFLSTLQYGLQGLTGKKEAQPEKIATAVGTAIQAAPLGLGLRRGGKVSELGKVPRVEDIAIERPLEVPPELQRPALPGPQGFTLVEPPPETILRPGPSKPPKGKAVEISAEGEPIYREGQKPILEEPVQPIEFKKGGKVKVREISAEELLKPEKNPYMAVAKEPGISIEELKKTPSLADYVIKRPELHEKEVVDFAKETQKALEQKTTPKLLDLEKEENGLIARSYEKELSPGEINRLKAIRFESITEAKKGGVEFEDVTRSDLEAMREKPLTESLGKEKISPEGQAEPIATPKEAIPSPVAKGEQLLPGMKVGLEFPKKGKEVTPTFEGTPLGEAAARAEVERVQPKLALEQVRYSGEIQELLDTVKTGEPGKRVFKETGEVTGYGSSYPNFMKNKGWGKEEVITALEKGLRGEPLREKQKRIWDMAKQEARGIFKDRLTEQQKAKVESIPTADLNVGDKVKVKGEVLKVTEKTPKEIVIKDGQEYRLDPVFDRIEGKRVERGILTSEKGAIQIPVEEIKRVSNRFREFWSPLSTLPQKEKLMGERSKAMGDMARVERIVEKTVDLTKNLSDQNKLEIFEAMDGRCDPATMSPESAKLAHEFTTINNIVGKMLVERDLISEKAYQKHKGQYVKYLYLKHFLGDDVNIPMGRNGKIDINALKARKDLTVDQKKAIGWIEDVAVAEPIGLAQSLGNVVKYDYLDQIASDPRNVWTPSIINISDIPKEYPQKIAKAQATRLTRQTGDPHGTFHLPNGNWAVKNMTTKEFVGKRMGIGELAEEVDLYQRMAKENPNSPEIAQRLQVYEKYLNDAKQATQNVPKDFIQMPTAKTWGPLAGSFIRKEIARDLTSFYGREKGNIEGLSKAVDVLSQIDAKATGVFKVGKVPLNLPTVVRNTISNVIQLNMSGMNPVSIGEYMVKAGENMLKKTPEHQKAFRHGLFKTNWSVVEINEVMDQFRSLQGNSWGEVVGAVQKVAKYYGKIDDFFKMAKYLEQREGGASVLKAVSEAQKWGMDYSLADPSIKWARKHFIPFVSYQYKIAPLIVESAYKRPWVIGKYLAAPYVLGEMVKEIYKGQMTEEDWKDLERTIPAEVTRRNSYMILPWKINDKWYWFDYSYFLPWGNYTQALSAIKEGDIKGALTQFGIGGTPIITLLKTFTSAGMRNEPPKDSFSGYPIYNQLDDPLTKALKASEYLYNQFSPSMLTRYGALGYTFDIGKEDRYGRTVPAEQAVGKLFGVNLHEANPKLAAIVKAAKIHALRDEYLKINMDPNLTLKQKEKYAKRFTTEIQNIVNAGTSPLKEEIRQPQP